MKEEKYWDETGKLVSEINFDNFSKENTYLKIGYFTRNNFALSTEYIWEMKNESREGKSTYYGKDGKLIREEIYEQGLIKKDIIYTGLNQKAIRSYENNEPFDGDFIQEAGPFSFFYTMEKGKKTGKETVKNTDRQEIVAEGLYKDNLPFEGKFISTDRYIVSNYKNGILDGVQTIYDNFYDDVPAEEFEVKNGKREGFRKIYENGELKYESIYKNDTIISGKIKDDGAELTYVDGNLTERIVFAEYDEGIELIEKFVNNEISSVEYFNFTIEEIPQESYLGEYKNGKPFRGYFAGQVIVDAIRLIDYYENGTIKYQYSFDIIEQMDNYRHYTYNQKAEFKNGKVVNGMDFLPPTDNGYLTLKYRNEKIEVMEANLFAMHYFNRISFVRNTNEILVKEFQSPYTVKIFPKNGMVTASLYENEKLLKTQDPVEEVNHGSPNSSTVYYLKDNQIRSFSFQRDTFEELEEIDRHAFTVKIFSVFPMMGKVTLDDVMDHFSKVFQSDDFEHIFEAGDSSSFPFTEREYLSFVEYDEKGNPRLGIQIKQEENGEIILEAIEDNKLKKSVKVMSIADLTANGNKVLEDLMHQLLNDF